MTAEKTSESLMCHLCRNSSRDAVIPACQHESCRMSLCQNHHSQDLPSGALCPTCRKNTAEEQDHPVAIPLQDMAGSGQVQSGRGVGNDHRPCTSCRDTSSSFFCTDCCIFMCEVCCSTHLDRLSGTAKHNIVSSQGTEQSADDIVQSAVNTNTLKDHFPGPDIQKDSNHLMVTEQTRDQWVSTRMHHPSEDFEERFAERKDLLVLNIEAIESQQRQVHKCMGDLEGKIQEVFEGKVKVLQDRMSSLLDEVAALKQNLTDRLTEMGDCYRNMLQEMTNCMTLMRGHQRNGPFDQGGVITTTLISNDLDNLLRRDVSAVTDHIKETALEAKFYPADKDFLDIGKLHLVNLETKTATGTPQVQVKISPKERQMVQVDDIITFPPPIDASKNNVDPDSIQVRRHNSYLQVPSPPCKKSLTLIKVVSLPYDVEGMAAVSHERVTVTYNNYDVGCSIVTASGVIYSHLKGRVKMASDTAFLSDGRSVVSHGGDLRVYNADGTPTNLRFRCQTGFDSCKISTDHWDNIYLVNGNSSIFVYHLGSANARRIISTSELTPRQICVTDSGLMVTSTCDILPSTVTVFDGDGRLGRSVRASHNGEYLYAATDGRNRVFVARVAESSRKLMVVVYTLWGTHLQEEVVLQEFQLSEKVSFLTSWCYLVCLAPNTLAFAHRNKLYFLRVPVPKA